MGTRIAYSKNKKIIIQTPLKTIVFSIACMVWAIPTQGQELTTYRGFVNSKFQLSQASRVSEEKKASLKRTIKLYAEREPALTAYFNKVNSNDSTGAHAILSQDKFFKNKDGFTLAYMFSLARMQSLNELFRPCIQVYDDAAKGIIISCSKEQFDDLTEEDTRVFEITCRYIGELYVDNVKLYEMVRYR
jgi:hypothetical protein